MKNRAAAAALILGMLAACSRAEAPGPTGPSSNPAPQFYVVRLVFVDCYEPVLLSVNGVEIVDRRFETQSETGLSGVVSAELTPQSRFRLTTGNLNVERVVEIDEGTRIVYVNPRNAPYITTSASDVIMLD